MRQNCTYYETILKSTATEDLKSNQDIEYEHQKYALDYHE